MRFKVVAMLAVLLGGLLAVPGSASASDPVIRPVLGCAELARDLDMPGTHVRSASVVDGYCDVRGYVEPAVGFQLKLPIGTYTGRYLQYGCGGFCGWIFEPAFPRCGPGQAGDFAVAATDDGHLAPPGTAPGKFAEHNQAARDDWFFRAPHVVSLAAKRIITAYYGSPPTVSYFNGCSNGGREGLLLAQRYPHDFDGIIAGASVNYLSALGGVWEPWRARLNTDQQGKPVLTDAKLPVLHNAVLAACDRLDGLSDGQLDDPRACRFDPASLRCPPRLDRPGCLTAAQIDVARQLYAGPVDAAGRRYYPGGQTYGSELAWAGYITPLPALGVSIAEYLGDNYLKYVGYPLGTPHSSVANFRLNPLEFHRLTAEGYKANALGLDLREFRRAGGKLIMWHGWADPDVPPAGSMDYYQRLWQHSGGLRETQKWARLFMVPTVYHCFGGSALTTFDPLPELVNWVERDHAPDRIIATGPTRSRPVFPHPAQPRYTGTGSINDASNFVPHQPPNPPNDTITWLGNYLHYLPGPVARLIG